MRCFALVVAVLVVGLAGGTRAEDTSAQGVLIGSIEYLDARYGFRDIKLGCAPPDISGLQLKATHNDVKNYTRKDEKLVLNKVKLKSIEYFFYKDRLFQISLTATVSMGDLLSLAKDTYGLPSVTSKVGSILLYTWEGKRALAEYLYPGGEEILSISSKSIKEEKSLDERKKKTPGSEL